MENSTGAKKQLPAFAVLAIIAVIAALLLGVTNAITKGPIEEHRLAALSAAYSAVMPGAADYSEMDLPADMVSPVDADGNATGTVTGLVAARDADGNVIGYCVSAASDGYAGPVAMIFGVSPTGTITGCVVGDNTFAETDGFGARAKEDSFREQFLGMSVLEDGAFVPLTGATFTSKAVLNASRAAVTCVAKVCLKAENAGRVNFGERQVAVADTSALVPGARLKGVGVGYEDADVIVRLTLGDDATIASIKVDASSQTPGIGQRCEGAEFTQRFIGKSIPVADVDVLSGATLTSNAVIEAINGAAPNDEEEPAAEAVQLLTEADGMSLGVNGAGAAVIAAPGYTGTVNVTLTVENGQVVGGEMSQPEPEVLTPATEPAKASAEGYESDVWVTLTLDAEGRIATLKIDAKGETPGLGQRAMEDAYVQKFIGKKPPLDQGVDVLTGATFTSNAVIEAINKAAKKAVPLAVETAVSGPEVLTPATEPAKASAEGYESDVWVTLTLDAEGCIATLKIDAKGETPGLGQRAMEDAYVQKFLGKKPPLDQGVDVLTGATFTSNAVIEAINKAAKKAVPLNAETAAAPAADTYTGTAVGYEQPITVTFTLDAEGKIATLTVDASSQTPMLGGKCADAAFTSQFIGKAAPFKVGEGIDAVSSATLTSNAVCEAINSALGK